MLTNWSEYKRGPVGH